MRLLLDTAILIWAVESPDRLSKRASAALKNPDSTLELSTASVCEIAIKSSIGKLRFSERELHQALDDVGIRILPLRAEHAFAVFGLPIHHKDPFDRQIIAQALSEEIPVVTPDEKFKLYRELKIIW